MISPCSLSSAAGSNAVGAEVRRGTLDDVHDLRSAADDSDGSSTSPSSTTSPSPSQNWRSRSPPAASALPSSSCCRPRLHGGAGRHRPAEAGLRPHRHGAARWPAVHRLDAAHLFRLAPEKAPEGSTLHTVADQAVSLRAVAEVTGRHLGLPVTSVAPEDTAARFGRPAPPLDSPASSARTRELLGWRPTSPGLVDDLEEGHYFDVSAPTDTW